MNTRTIHFAEVLLLRHLQNGSCYLFIFCAPVTVQCATSLESCYSIDRSVVFASWRQCALPSNPLFLGPTRGLHPNGISIRSAVLLGTR